MLYCFLFLSLFKIFKQRLIWLSCRFTERTNYQVKFFILLINYTIGTRVTDEIGALCAFQYVTIECRTDWTPVLLILPFFFCYRAIQRSLNIRISFSFLLTTIWCCSTFVSIKLWDLVCSARGVILKAGGSWIEASNMFSCYPSFTVINSPSSLISFIVLRLKFAYECDSPDISVILVRRLFRS